MISIQELINKFNLDLKLPTHILKLNFVGDYTKCILIDDDPEFPGEKCYHLIDEHNGYVISISLPEGEVRSLEFWDGYVPEGDYDCEWEESYSYDDETIPNYYINN